MIFMPSFDTSDDDALRQALDAALESHVNRIDAAPRLQEAIRYALLGPGKRLRPMLCVHAARLGTPPPSILSIAGAIEMIHAYSLVHDDLPSMDNDALRRGRPTLHIAFDEATAILAGDALLTLAFETLSLPLEGVQPETQVKLLQLLAKASGGAGMVGGQYLDLSAEGRFGEAEPFKTAEAILSMQALKTGRLIEAACHMGGLAGGLSGERLENVIRFGRLLGTAFQIRDDLLDHEGTVEAAGKATGKDAAAGKATLVGLWGVKRTKDYLEELQQQTENCLKGFGEAAGLLLYSKL